MTDEETGLYETKIRLESTEGLNTGTTVKLSLCSNRAEQALTIPVDAVYYENSLPYVFTYDNGVVHKVFIEAGIYDSERRQVMSGLDADTDHGAGSGTLRRDDAGACRGQYRRLDGVHGFKPADASGLLQYHDAEAAREEAAEILIIPKHDGNIPSISMIYSNYS